MGDVFNGALHRFFGLHLKDEMHSSLEIQAEINFFVRPHPRFDGGKKVDDSRYNDAENDNQTPWDIFQCVDPFILSWSGKAPDENEPRLGGSLINGASENNNDDDSR